MGSSTSQYKSRVTVRMYVRNALKMYACIDKLQIWRETSTDWLYKAPLDYHDIIKTLLLIGLFIMFIQPYLSP